MFCLAVLLVPVLLLLTYDWFGWFGPIVAVVCCLYWQSKKMRDNTMASRLISA